MKRRENYLAAIYDKLALNNTLSSTIDFGPNHMGELVREYFGEVPTGYELRQKNMIVGVALFDTPFCYLGRYMVKKYGVKE
jgi:hypothetical protein